MYTRAKSPPVWPVIIMLMAIIRALRFIKIFNRLFLLVSSVKPLMHTRYSVILENNRIPATRKSRRSNPAAMQNRVQTLDRGASSLFPLCASADDGSPH